VKRAFCILETREFEPKIDRDDGGQSQLGVSIIAGGPSPFIATALFATFQSSLPIALYILGCGIIGIIALLRTWLLARRRELSRVLAKRCSFEASREFSHVDDNPGMRAGPDLLDPRWRGRRKRDIDADR
jgi:hypothetical protein